MRKWVSGVSTLILPHIKAFTHCLCWGTHRSVFCEYSVYMTRHNGLKVLVLLWLFLSSFICLLFKYQNNTPIMCQLLSYTSQFVLPEHFFYSAGWFYPYLSLSHFLCLFLYSVHFSCFHSLFTLDLTISTSILCIYVFLLFSLAFWTYLISPLSGTSFSVRSKKADVVM